MRPILSCLILVAIVSFARPTSAQESWLSDFIGHWKGVGISEQTSESGDFEYANRDLDIEIKPAEDGFSVSWTAALRNDGGSLIRKSARLEFREVNPGVFEAPDRADAALSHAHTWARLTTRSLVVYVFEIDEAGVYELSQYVRTLTAPGQMELGYTRQRDGRPVRSVIGRLARVPE